MALRPELQKYSIRARVPELDRIQERVTERYKPRGERVEPAPAPRNEGVVMRVPSSRNPSQYYSVAIYPTGRAECECDGFRKWRRGRDCSHIDLVREALKEGRDAATDRE